MKPITLYIFVHDDVPASIASTLGRGYFKEFTDEISSISSRPFVFNEVRHVQGVTDQHYKGQNPDEILRNWEIAAVGYKNDKGLEWGKTERYILVTKDPINETVLGCAYSGKPAVIACTQSYQVIAHEVGHSFNATHEDAELGWNAWGGECETYMYPQISNVRGNCYRYTPKNREHIKAFLSDAP